MAGKVYVPKSSGKMHTFSNGDSLIRLNFKADDLIAFVKQHANERGWITLVVSERKEPSDKGATHSIYLDDFQPRPQGVAEPPAGNSARRSGPVREPVMDSEWE